MKDFFISYNREDRKWAEWVARHLEEAGYRTIIQAWDFTGNWVLQMNEAMRETPRTIAVLSSSYVKARYTQSEWANAFRLDPTGEKGLLIPVRVRPVELDGVLAQLVYLDLVGLDEATAVELLLKRVRGERGKPSTKPALPSSTSESVRATREASPAPKPVYPAFDEDTKRMIHARELLVRWRSLYSGQQDALRIAAEKARRWNRSLPMQFDDDVATVVDLASRVARDFRSLPVRELEFARTHGLMVHETVFWGQALDSVDVTHTSYGPGRIDEHKRVDEEMRAAGIPVDALPGAYAFEMVARVLESAVGLAQFRLDALPRGFIEDVGPGPSDDLGTYRSLLVAVVDDDAGVQLMSMDGRPEKLGTFGARKSTPLPQCAQQNTDSSIELVASDGESVYRWSRSGQYPSLQFPREGTIIHASFVSKSPEADVVTVSFDGNVRVLRTDGSVDRPFGSASDVHLRSAVLWIDPLIPEQWSVFSLTDHFDLVSQPRVGSRTERSADALWDDAAFHGVSDEQIWWQGNADLAMHEIDGLPCLVVRRQAAGGEGVHFLDPLSLTAIRPPVFIRGFVGDVVIVGGRWMTVFFLQRGVEILPRVAVWDLQTGMKSPVGTWFARKADVYHPIVTRETRESFEVVFVLRLFEGSQDRWLCRFRWPTGEVEEIEKYSNPRILPVT